MNRQFFVLLGVLMFVVLLTTLVIKRYDPQQPGENPNQGRAGEIYGQLGRAYASREMHDLGSCERLLRRVLELDSDNIYALSMLGELYLSEARYAAAETIFARLGLLAPNSAAVFANCGMAQAMQKKYDAAAKSFQRSLELDANSPAVHFHLAAVAAARKDFERADSELSAAEKLMPRTLMLMPDAPHFNELLLYRASREAQRAAAGQQPKL